MAVHEIPNIRPFNDTYFIDCTFPSFFTAVKNFKGSVFSYIANYSFVYKLDHTSNGLSLQLEKLPAEKFTTMNRRNHITAEYRNNLCKDITDIVIDSLLKGSLVLLPIDAYYYKHPFHDLYYLKEHHSHFILIYGFDTNRRIFKTVESNGFEWNNNNCCYKHELSFDDLVLGHEGIVNHVKTDMTLGILSKDNPDHSIIDDPKANKKFMIDNLRLHKNNILLGLDCICELADNIEQFDISKGTLFDNKIASLSNMYKIKHILDYNQTYEQILQKILDNWRMIEMMVYRNEFQGIISKERFSARLHQLYKLESSLYESLYSDIDNRYLLLNP